MTTTSAAATAVIVHVAGRFSESALLRTLHEISRLPGTDPYLVHDALDPVVVTRIVAAAPRLRLVRLPERHYAQFRTDGAGGGELSDLAVAEALRIEGYRRLIVLPHASRGDVALARVREVVRSDGAALRGRRWYARPAHLASAVVVLPGDAATGDSLDLVDERLSESGVGGLWAALKDAAKRAGGRARAASLDVDASDDHTKSGRESRPGAGGLQSPRKTHATAPHATHEEARERLAAADPAAARALLLDAAAMPGGLRGETLLLLARASVLLGDHESARHVLRLVTGDAAVLAEARREEAEIAWTTHDREAGLAAAEHAVRANPASPRALAVRSRLAEPATGREPFPERASAAPVLAHVAGSGMFSTDPLDADVLHSVRVPALRATIASVSPVAGWVPLHADQVLDDAGLALVNSTDGVVVGADELVLRGPRAAASGWAWNASADRLARLDVPLALFASRSGLARPDGDDGASAEVPPGLIAAVDRACLVAVGDEAAAARLRGALPARLAERVVRLPAVTTVRRALGTRDVPAAAPRASGGPGFVLVCTTRADDEAASWAMAHAATALRAKGVPLGFVTHGADGEAYAIRLAAELGPRVPVHALAPHAAAQAAQAVEAAEAAEAAVAAADLVVTSRHAVAELAFGLGTPVLFLPVRPGAGGSFLVDAGLDGWEVDPMRTGRDGVLVERALEVLADVTGYRASVAKIQEEWVAQLQMGLGRLVSAVAR